MADKSYVVAEGAVKKLVDMGDGTHAERVALAPAGYSAEITCTPANAAYLGNDVMDVVKAINWVDRNGVAFPGGELVINYSRLQVAHTALVTGESSYLLALYKRTPTTVHADNDAWDVPANTRDDYIDQLPLGTPVDLGTTLKIGIQQNMQITVLSGGVSYGELITVGACTPNASGLARKITLHGYALL